MKKVPRYTRTLKEAEERKKITRRLRNKPADKTMQSVLDWLDKKDKIKMSKKLKEQSKPGQYKFYTVAFEGATFKNRVKWGYRGSAALYIDLGTFSYNLKIPTDKVPVRNKKLKILAAFEDKIREYLNSKLNSIVLDITVKKPILRRKCSIKTSIDIIQKPKNIDYVLKMARLDKNKLIDTIVKDLKIRKGLHYYD